MSKTVYSLELSVSLNFSMLPSASRKVNSFFSDLSVQKKWSAGLLQTSPPPSSDMWRNFAQVRRDYSRVGGGGTWHVSPFPVEERNIYAITATYLVQIILYRSEFCNIYMCCIITNMHKCY